MQKNILYFLNKSAYIRELKKNRLQWLQTLKTALSSQNFVTTARLQAVTSGYKEGNKMQKCDVINALGRYVRFDGHIYKVLKYEAFKDEREVLHHSLCLLDRHGNCTVTAPIERIDIYENELP